MWNLSPKAVSRHCEILDGRCIGFISWTEEVRIPMLQAAEPSMEEKPSASASWGLSPWSRCHQQVHQNHQWLGRAPSLCTGQYTQQSFPLMVLCSSSSQLMISLSAHCLPGLNPWLQVTAVWTPTYDVSSVIFPSKPLFNHLLCSRSYTDMNKEWQIHKWMNEENNRTCFCR